ncbi:MAG: DNA methyltransferase, partial [Minicystis sp.]
MQNAYGQAMGYARVLSTPPPFLIVCDIGHCFDLYACFDGTSRYRPFPDAERRRLSFDDLAQHEGILRTIWTDPRLLDPSKQAAKASERAADSLALLAETLRAAGHPTETVAVFLRRCVFSMIAEDIGLLPRGIFTRSLEDPGLADHTAFLPELERLGRALRDGAAPGLDGSLRRFGGGLFDKPSALSLTEEALRQLQEAAAHDWSTVDPAILGTLLERALAAKGKYEPGSSYTPRTFIERLVRPTVEDPLRAAWSIAHAEARLHAEHGRSDAAARTLRDFQAQLTRVRVLDPACGAGGFLCVALDVLHELESEARAALRELGEPQAPHDEVSPAQMFGIEVRPDAQAIAELMLWMTHLKRRSRARTRPSLETLLPMPQIEARDALLTWDAVEPVRDGKGNPVTRWDGETMKKASTTTGEVSPEESARRIVEQYVNPRRAEWPAADFIAGNPPFMGRKRMPASLGEDYVTALRAAYPELPNEADYVMYFWGQAARTARQGTTRRFGFITVNSILRISEQRLFARLFADPKRPLRIIFSIPDHPLTEAGSGAAVRVAMVVVERADDGAGTRAELASPEGPAAEALSRRFVPSIEPTLLAGASVALARPLVANTRLCSTGIALQGDGFLLSEHEVSNECSVVNQATSLPVVRPYLRGRDVLGRPSHARVIDFFGLDRDQAAALAPALFRRLEVLVRPVRELGARAATRSEWWRFGRDPAAWRAVSGGLARYISTPEIARHRIFAFVEAIALPDRTLTSFALDDAYFLGVLSSRVHVTWALASGSSFANESRYPKTSCFDPFPFPACAELQRQRIRELGELLDAHRKRRQAAHPTLTVTRMYNVLSKLRSGSQLDEEDRILHEQGQVGVMAQIHDDLDHAVSDAYNWPADLLENELLEKIHALNLERAN